MNMRFLSRTPVFLLFIASSLALSSCGLFNRQEQSRVTGWDLGDPRSGEFGRSSISYHGVGPGMVYIEGGSFLMGRTDEDVMFDWNNVPRRVSVASFYMDETEISNFEYREYLNWLSKVFKPTHPEVYNKALPDTLVWLDPAAYNEPFVENYLRHPAFDDYPVVGVSWVQASDFASWRTDRVNEWILIKNGHLLFNLDEQTPDNHFTTQTYLSGEYQGLVRGDQQQRVRWEEGLLFPRYRLPTEAEWEYAALGLIGNTVDDNVMNRRIYPWDGNSVRITEGRNRGQFRANFQRSPGDLAGVAGIDSKSGEFTMPVNSFWPNDYGLYNMAGNVNEWVFDQYIPHSHAVASSNQRFPLANNPQNANSQQANQFENGAMNAGQNGLADLNGIDHNEFAANDIHAENQLRVYKGGSWKDRPYWLSPSTRRFLNQNQAANDIGFRCAMGYVGRQSK